MSARMRNIIIDGSTLEGGGQILRNGVSLSALLSKPISIQKIRNGRTPPGLKNQHRTGLELAAEIASANLVGAINGSTEIHFTPGGINLPQNYSADSVTAGSTTLLLQIALPLLLFSSKPVPASTLTLHGGTNATLAPQIDYTKHVFLPFIRRHFGIGQYSLDIKKRGYFPRGGGEVEFKVEPLCQNQKLRSINLLERGKVKWIRGISHHGGLPGAIGIGMIAGAQRRLALAGYGQTPGEEASPNAEAQDVNNVTVSIQHVQEPRRLTKGPGSGIIIWAELEGGGMIAGSAVGTKKKSPEEVGEIAANELLQGLDNGGCVDEWLQDQIIILMALAEGKSQVMCGKGGLSLHTRTAIWLAEQLTEARFEVEEQSSGMTVIRCEGIGYTAPHATPK